MTNMKAKRGSEGDISESGMSPYLDLSKRL